MIKEIELALQARIQSRMTYLKSVVTFQGDDTHVEELLAEAVRTLPAAVIVWTGARYHQRARTVFDKEARFVVIVATVSRRSEEARRHGDEVSKGTYALLEDLESALLGQTLGLDITPIVPEEVESLFSGSLSDRHLSLYGAGFSTAWRVEAQEDDSTELAEIQGSYRLDGNDPVRAEDKVSTEG